MLGVIGGTGLYQLEGLEIKKTEDVETPFGRPSAAVTIGNLEGREVAFLPRHGTHHTVLPHEINYRANLFALKQLGVEQIVSVSATGSLQKEIAPGDLSLISQYFDWTRGKRHSSFFGEGIVAHVSSAKPSCESLSETVIQSAKQLQIPLHPHKTYGCVEGPRFGTRAESFFLRNAGCDLVGMTNVPEAFLAREAQICYCTIAVATDYDCWMDDPTAHVTMEKAMQLYKANLGKIRSILGQVIKTKTGQCKGECRKVLAYSVMSPKDSLSKSQQKILEILSK